MKTVACILVVCLAVGTPSPALAYLKLGVRVGPTTVDVRWSGAVPYFVAERGAPEVSAAQLRDAVARAFATWQSVPTATVRSQFQGFTTAVPAVQDERTVIGFADRPDLDRVLGATSFVIDATTGEIREVDVFFNTSFAWSVAPGGEAGRQDLESIALHEIGHLLGLGHSALGETEMAASGRRVIASGSVMFPIALSPGATADRVLQADDIAGIGDLYSGSDFASSTSSIAGRVTKNGAPVVGAHVVAVNLADGALVGGFTVGTQGEYVVAGLSPGAYVVRVEPLDDVEPESFFPGVTDVDFRATYSSRVVIAPQGAGVQGVSIEVQNK